jgi:hypothetical protein
MIWKAQEGEGMQLSRLDDQDVSYSLQMLSEGTTHGVADISIINQFEPICC